MKRELEGRFNRFLDLTGQLPTHIDSHHHVHREFNVGRFFIELSRRYGLPLRGCCEVVYVSRLYGECEYGKTEERYISVEFLISLLRGVKPGFSEISCHPGYVTADFDSLYNREREIELKSLTDPRVKAAIEEEGITLVNYRDYLSLATPA